MEGIRKKLAALKEEVDSANERAEDAEREKKEALAKLDEVCNQ